MKISYQLIQEFLPQLKASPEEIAEELSQRLAEVENVHKVGGDFILEIENKALTHRPDCFSHWGIARELAAYFNLPFVDPVAAALSPLPRSRLSIKIKSPFCLRYSAALLKVRVKPSPSWLQEILNRLDLRTINNVVDITNYVMIKYGQPLHAFDAATVQEEGKINLQIRAAQKKERLKTLDGRERELDPSILVIANENKALALAGIMGGAESEVKENTQEIVLESANFEMYSLRRASRQLGLRTPASTRFEKGPSPQLTRRGLSEAVALLQKLAAAELEEWQDLYPQPAKATIIDFYPAESKKILGLSLEEEEIAQYLQNFGLEIKPDSREQWKVKIPFFRRDLRMKIDLWEEVARAYGLNRLPPTLPQRSLKPTHLSPLLRLKRDLRQILSRTGFDEVYSYSFVDPQLLKKLGFDLGSALAIKNPVRPELSFLRPTLLPGLLEKAALNYPRFNELAFFELGRRILVAEPPQELPWEKETLALLFLPQERKDSSAYYGLKGIVELLNEKLFNKKIEFDPLKGNYPFLRAEKGVGLTDAQGRNLGYLGLFNSEIAFSAALEKVPFAVAELYLEPLLDFYPPQPRYQTVPPHPALKEDLTFILPRSANLSKVTAAILKAGQPWLRQAKIFALFTDSEQLGEEEKAVSWRLFFQSPEKSLSHQEIAPLVEKILSVVKSQFQGFLRQEKEK